MELKDKLKQLRIEKGFSQKKIADLLGVSLSTVQKMEYGDIKIKNEIIIKICDIFDISIQDFLGDDKNYKEKLKLNLNLDILRLEKELQKYRNDVKQREEIQNNKDELQRYIFLLKSLFFPLDINTENFIFENGYIILKTDDLYIKIDIYDLSKINNSMKNYFDFLIFNNNGDKN